MLSRRGRRILGQIRRIRVVLECRVPIFESRLIPLIKDGTLREHNALGGWVVEAPSLVTIRIAKEDALLHVRTKGTVFVLLDMNVGKDAQVRYNWQYAKCD